MQSPTDPHLNYSYATSTSSIAPQPAPTHPHMRQPEYPTSEQPRGGVVMNGYNAYANSSQAPVTPQMASQVPSQLMQHAAQFSPSAHQYPTNESDANYWRIMFRELGFGEEGGAYPSINSIHGYSTTMPDIGPASSAAMAANVAYQQQQQQQSHHQHQQQQQAQDTQMASPTAPHVNGHSPHGSFSQQANRHYQSYPQQSYAAHPSQHPSYNGGYVGR